MAADFEEESRLATDTITRQGSNPNVTTGVITGAILLAVLGVAWWASSGVKNRPQSAQEEAFNTARLQSSIGGPAARTLAPADNRFVIPPASPVVTPSGPAAVVIPQGGLQVTASILDDSEAKRLAVLERLRKEHEAQLQARLRSSMLVIDGKDPAASVDPSVSRVSAEAKEEDANRAFLKNAADDVSVAHAVKHQRIDALVPQGTMIRGVLETAIQSDLPGMVRAIISEDVYSFDGRRVLIPRGTMLTGEYRSALSRGQTRVFLIWTRLLRSDGVSLIINSYGTDGLGRSGLAGEVDRHFFERFGAATLLTVAGGAAQFVGQIGNQSQNSGWGISVLDPATGALIPLTNGGPNSSTQYGQQIGSQAIAQSITRLRDHTPRGLRDALAHAVQNHVTMVISGGTSSGKTTFLNALLKEVPDTERVISIEDTRELQPPQPNWLSLLASKGDQGTSKVTIQDLLESSLRLRPDRLFLGEIRGAEAATFLQAVNTGHPGSLTTLHADSTYSAFDRLALMTLQSDLKLTKAEILEYVRSVVPMVVQLRRRPTRGVAEIYLRCYGQDKHK